MFEYLYELDNNKIENLPHILNFVVEMRVKLTKNIFIKIGLANESLGTVHKIITDNSSIQRTILLHMPNASFNPLPGLDEKIVLINSHPACFMVKLKNIVMPKESIFQHHAISGAPCICAHRLRDAGADTLLHDHGHHH